MALGYAWEKLFKAVLGMARSSESVQERLADAYIYGFHPISLGAGGDLPEELQPAYRRIVERLTKIPGQQGEGSVVATTRAMSDAEAREVIEDIVSLYDEVARRLGPD